MKTENYPSWLVPLEIAKSLKEIGFNKPTQNTTSSDILESKRYKEENKIYSQNYILKGSSYNANNTKGGISIPTWEQVFEWFREKDFRITLENHKDSTKFIFYNMKIKEGKHFKGEFSTYEEAREKLAEQLIKVYKNENCI
jgi:hypothetical protein